MAFATGAKPFTVVAVASAVVAEAEAFAEMAVTAAETFAETAVAAMTGKPVAEADTSAP